MTDTAPHDEVLAFWRQAGPDRWFNKDDGLDAACRQRFEALWQDASSGRLAGWEATPDGALALVLLLDQMPRNMFRGTAKAYASDPAAREAAHRAVARGFDRQVEPALRRFLYLPFMHSETLADQDRSVALCEAMGDADVLKWARHHRDIIARFGRFPHRNAVLGRRGTPAEAAFLAADGAFKG
ncbi:MAG: DUF924 domain-containing protein [Alphaproteobacteria bacterium]|nr:DUF924 domain-containing protein [Alphaproteobacteria bacterium]